MRKIVLIWLLVASCLLIFLSGCTDFPFPYCGNNVVDANENCLNCPRDVLCADREECIASECVFIGLCGNNVADVNENCLNCFEDVPCAGGEECIAGECILTGLCDNGLLDIGENCLTCPADVQCANDEECVDGNCIKKKCADETLHATCSLDKPKYCENGVLIDNCSVCGCNSGYKCEDRNCVEEEVNLCVGIICDDANPCTEDSCDSNTGLCSNESVADETSCGTNKVCQSGVCIIADLCAGVDCDDLNPCTNDLCNSNTGECSNLVVADGIDCGTYKECISGQCTEVPNILPVADAGPDQTISVGSAVVFDGSSSSDIGGTITEWSWSEASTVLNTGSTFTKSDFAVGQYTITLTVTDERGDSNSDTVVITVNPLTEQLTGQETTGTGLDYQLSVINRLPMVDSDNISLTAQNIADYVSTNSGKQVVYGLSAVDEGQVGIDPATGQLKFFQGGMFCVGDCSLQNYIYFNSLSPIICEDFQCYAPDTVHYWARIYVDTQANPVEVRIYMNEEDALFDVYEGWPGMSLFGNNNYCGSGSVNASGQLPGAIDVAITINNNPAVEPECSGTANTHSLGIGWTMWEHKPIEYPSTPLTADYWAEYE